MRLLDEAVLAGGDASVVVDPYNAANEPVVGRRAAGEQHLRRGVRPAEVEHAHLLLLAAGEQARRAGRDRDGPDDMVVRKGVQRVAAEGVPELAASRAISGAQDKQRRCEGTYAVKSALPDAARAPSLESLVLQTAPLWPRKVPIQSPVHSRSIGFPSLHPEMRRYDLSSSAPEKERWVTGRVCPGATRGTTFGGKLIACDCVFGTARGSLREARGRS
jgi:hypothetical protein